MCNAIMDETLRRLPNGVITEQQIEDTKRAVLKDKRRDEAFLTSKSQMSVADMIEAAATEGKNSMAHMLAKLQIAQRNLKSAERTLRFAMSRHDNRGTSAAKQVVAALRQQVAKLEKKIYGRTNVYGTNKR